MGVHQHDYAYVNQTGGTVIDALYASSEVPPGKANAYSAVYGHSGRSSSRVPKAVSNPHRRQGKAED